MTRGQDDPTPDEDPKKRKTRGKGEGAIYQRKDGVWCASIELPEGLDGKRRRNPPPIGGMCIQITPHSPISPVSIFRANGACFPVLARIFYGPTTVLQWGSNPPVSAPGSPVTQRSYRGSPHKPGKSPHDHIDSTHETPRTVKF